LGPAGASRDTVVANDWPRGISTAAAYAGSERDGALAATASSGTGEVAVSGIVAELDVPNLPKVESFTWFLKRVESVPKP
jgi:hypothetical protein